MQVHFDNNQFEQNRKDGKKMLCPFARPNLLNKQEETTLYANDANDANINSDSNINSDININSDANINIVNGDNINCVHESLHDIELNISEPPKAATMGRLKDITSNDKMYNETYVRKLKKTLKKTMLQNNILKKKLHKTNAKFRTVFNEDQTNCIIHNTQRGSSWSADTITKALRLYVSCGQKGYEELRRQNLPYPSIRTLQYRIQGLKFKPGISEDIFNLLEIKVSNINLYMDKRNLFVFFKYFTYLYVANIFNLSLLMVL